MASYCARRRHRASLGSFRNGSACSQAKERPIKQTRAFAMPTLGQRYEPAHHVFQNSASRGATFLLRCLFLSTGLLYFGCHVLLNGVLVALVRSSCRCPWRPQNSGAPRVSLSVDSTMYAAKNTAGGTHIPPLLLRVTLQRGREAAIETMICDRALFFERQTVAKVSREFRTPPEIICLYLIWPQLCCF